MMTWEPVPHTLAQVPGRPQCNCIPAAPVPECPPLHRVFALLRTRSRKSSAELPAVPEKLASVPACPPLRHVPAHQYFAAIEDVLFYARDLSSSMPRRCYNNEPYHYIFRRGAFVLSYAL